jgi:predicted deacylase
MAILTPSLEPCDSGSCAPAKTPSAAALPAEFAAPSAEFATPSAEFAAPTDDPPVVTTIGYSGEGRPLTAVRFGSGGRVLLLVGGIHGGWESNTVTLTTQLIDDFTASPQAVLPGTSLVIVPVANPDGYARGRVFSGRLNSAGVDLNRNWACNWSPDAYWQQARVNPGASTMSEPETQALSAYISQIQPRAALFYHSSANGVFAGECGGDHGSAALSAVYGAAAGYRYGQPFSAYPVTGTASDWLDGQGIPSADVELITGYDSEFTRNLAGVTAVLAWLANSG